MEGIFPAFKMSVIRNSITDHRESLRGDHSNKPYIIVKYAVLHWMN